MQNASKQRQPVFFFGHGSPLNAVAQNSYTHRLNQLSNEIEKPDLILCVSAHWLTDGTFLTSAAHPKTIHDFYGFPDELFKIQYPALGHPELAQEIAKSLNVHLDQGSWGLDHGTWSVLRHIYPKANVPVIQLSIDLKQPPQVHYEWGQKLKSLREKNILVIGSGNLVHNLRRIDWNENATPFDWAVEFDQWCKDELLKDNHSAIVNDYLKTEAGTLSVPTPDHYYPFLYTLGASNPTEPVQFIYEGFQNASISMRCIRFG